MPAVSPPANISKFNWLFAKYFSAQSKIIFLSSLYEIIFLQSTYTGLLCPEVKTKGLLNENLIDSISINILAILSW